MPITTEACPGPCNNRAVQAWEQYDQAVIRYSYEKDLYADTVDRYQAAVAAWRIPLAYPAEPREPDRPQPPGIPVVDADPVWCGNCPKKIRNALHQINELVPILYADITGHRGAPITGPNGTKPLDPKKVIEKLDEVYGDLATVAAQWQHVRGHPSRPPAARGSHARNVTIGYLLEELSTILLHPGSVEFGLKVLAWERRLLKLSKSDPVSRRSAIRCPRCAERQLQREADGYYKCGSCGRLLNQDEHDREFWEQADEHEQQEVAAS